MTPSKTRSPIPSADKVPLKQKAAFSFGYGLDYLTTGVTTGILWLPYFNIGLGIQPAVLGAILMLMRIWDALTDPLMGNISDNTRTRFGRRRPYILVGAILTALFYLLIWRVPLFFENDGRLIALAIVGLFFFTCFTIWSVPFYSLQMELTPNYDERTRVAGWVSFSGKIVFLAGGWIMAFATSDLFLNPETNKPDLVKGIQATSWIIAAFAIVMGVVASLVVKERYYQATKTSGHKTQLWRSVRESLQCKPLWQLTAIMFCLMLGNAINNTLGQYASIYYLYGGDLAPASILAGWRSTSIMIIGIAGIPLWTWLSERFDKKLIVTWMLSLTVVGHLLNIFCLNPQYPYLWLVSSVLESGAISAVFLFMPSMKADVADWDEIHTKTRREGSLNAFFSWFIKIAMTLGAGSGAFALQLSGFDATLPEGQTAEVILRMKWLYIILPISIWVFTLFIMKHYPLDRGRIAAIREELEARRGAV